MPETFILGRVCGLCLQKKTHSATPIHKTETWLAFGLGHDLYQEDLWVLAHYLKLGSLTESLSPPQDTLLPGGRGLLPVLTYKTLRLFIRNVCLQQKPLYVEEFQALGRPHSSFSLCNIQHTKPPTRPKTLGNSLAFRRL